MKHTLRIAIIALLAIAALGLAIFRVEARTGESNASRLPSIEQRMVGEQPPAIEMHMTLTATPPAIDCDGVQSSTVTAVITDDNGQNIPDGTSVTFSVVAAGTANPVNATTLSGAASSIITPDADATGVTVIVSASEAQDEIRVDCANAGPCSPSPDSPMSPPCPTPTPTPIPSPPECTNPNLPPCDTPKPPSPPECTDPNLPPCETPETPPPSECADPNSPSSVSPPCATPEPPCVVGRPASPPGRGPRCPKPDRHPPSPPCNGHSNAQRCRPASTPETFCANVTGGKRVTLHDAIAIAVNANKRYNARYDVNRDGAVDAFDVLEAMRQLGRKC